ncbi:unnamed protein product [Arctogadus glacialis]
METTRHEASFEEGGTEPTPPAQTFVGGEQRKGDDVMVEMMAEWRRGRAREGNKKRQRPSAEYLEGPWLGTL